MSDKPAINDDTLPARPAGAASPPDELAKDLPGLPVELKRGRVDERGFDIRTRRHGDLLIPWSAVRGFRSFWHGSLMLEAQPPSECEISLAPLAATRAQKRLIRTAWREYVLRRIERDGELAGSYSLFRPVGQYRTAVGIGAVTMLAGVPALVVRSGASMEGGILLSRSLGIICLFAGALAIVAGALLRSRAYAAQLHWYRWRLTRDGLTFWPFAEEARLEPGPEDWIAPHAARLGRFAVPVENLTYREHAAALLLALGERSGARTRPLTWLQPSVLIVPMLVLWCVMIVFGAANVVLIRLYADTVGLLFPVAAWAAAVAASATAAHIVSRGRLRRALADGRAMLERLGW